MFLIMYHLLQILWKWLSLYSFPESFHQGKKKFHIMNWKKMTEIIMTFYHVQICSSIVFTSLAFTTLLQWSEIFCIHFVSQFYLSECCESCAEPCSPCWKNTVKHVNTQSYSKSKIYWITNSHQITRFVLRKSLTALPYGSEEVIFRLSSRKSSNSISWSIYFDHFIKNNFSQVRIDSTLNNGK